MKSRLTLGGISLLGLLGSLMIAYSTRWGPWVYSDSAGYIISARNLIAGNGLGLFGASGAFHPLTLHPPFYSILLGFFGLLGADLVTAARWIDVFLFGATIIGVGLIVYSLTHTTWISILSGLLVLSTPDLVDIFSGAMSEPLFIFMGLAGIALVLWFVRSDRRLVLIAAAIACGLSTLTRYGGVAFIITGVAGLLIFRRRAWKSRIIDVSIYGVLSSLPAIGWLTWLRAQPADDHLVRSGINLGEQFANFRISVIEIFWSWLPFTSLLPRYSYNLARDLLLLLVVLVLILTGISIIKRLKDGMIVLDPGNGFPLALLMITCGLVYLVILAFSYIFTLPTPDLIVRTLLPAHLTLFIGFFLLCFFIIGAWPTIKWLPVIPIFLVLGISTSYLHDSLDIVSGYHHTGAGYTDRNWRNSETIRAINGLPTDISLISNESAAVYFYTNRPAYDISELTNEKHPGYSHFGDDPGDPAQVEFRDHGAALVLFDSSIWQFARLYGDQAARRMQDFTQGLYLYAQLDDGAVYFHPSTLIK